MLYIIIIQFTTTTMTICKPGITTFLIFAVANSFSAVYSFSSPQKNARATSIQGKLGSVCDNQGQCYCPCNVNAASCDVNCCCDVDCSTEDISLFTVRCDNMNGNIANYARFLNEKGVMMTKCSDRKSSNNKKYQQMIEKPQQFSMKRLTDFVEVSFIYMRELKHDEQQPYINFTYFSFHN